MTAPELKPCPFCGADAEYSVISDEGQRNDYDTVACSVCPSEMRRILHWADEGGEGKDYLFSTWNRRADLAAVPAQVRVKPLVWTTRSGAPTAFGIYIVTCEDHDDVTVWFVLFGGKALARCGEHRTEEAAKAAAQSDYEASILAAIEPQPDPRDEVIARLVEALENRLHDQECPCNACSPMLAALAAAKAVQHG